MCVYVYTYICYHPQTVSLYHKSSVCLDTRDASKPGWLQGYLIPVRSSFSALVKNILRISFYIYVIGNWECSVYKKNTCIPTRVILWHVQNIRIPLNRTYIRSSQLGLFFDHVSSEDIEIKTNNTENMESWLVVQKLKKKKFFIYQSNFHIRLFCLLFLWCFLMWRDRKKKSL